MGHSNPVLGRLTLVCQLLGGGNSYEEIVRGSKCEGLARRTRNALERTGSTGRGYTLEGLVMMRYKRLGVVV